MYNTYCYKYNNLRYYGQGLTESYVRSAMASKLQIEETELEEGEIIKDEDKVSAINSGWTYYTELEDLLKQKPAAKMTVKEVANIMKLRYDDAKDLISYHLNIPKEVIYGLGIHKPLYIVSKQSNNRVKVKTYKIPNDEVGIVRKKNEEIVSRVDEFNKHIELLLSLDYNLMFVIDDLYYEYEKALSTYNNLSVKYNKRGIPDKTKNELGNQLATLKEDLNRYKSLLHSKYNRVHSTTYYVSDSYLLKDFNEVMAMFDSCYETIRNRLIRKNMDNIIPIGENFTLLEKLDSYQLVRTLNNRYTRIQKQ